VSGRGLPVEAGPQCVIIHPHTGGGGADLREPEMLLGEAIGLAHAIDLNVAHSEAVKVLRPKPGTYLGGGAVERIGALIHGDEDADSEADNETVVILDCALSPIQQRNLETAWNCKVIDRTGLILEIFGARAQTKEGRLQVELAALTYQRSRLVRSWTHLERQRGGAGFMGGPGERQIELDRRMIDQRIDRIKRDLKDVRRTRALHRDARKRVPYPVIALVGYTNAGKSTLFNRLTDANVSAKDQLFATLDPTMRAIDLPSRQKAILSDTVGFVSSLPHELVDAFHATLEEVQEADVIVHVRDIAHPESEAQNADVLGVLTDIGIDETVQRNLVEVLNKSDLLAPDALGQAKTRAVRANSPSIVVSALSGEGCDTLRQTLAERLSEGFETLEVNLDPADGATLAWLYRHGDVVEREDGDDGIWLRVRMSPIEAARYQHQSH